MKSSRRNMRIDGCLRFEGVGEHQLRFMQHPLQFSKSFICCTMCNLLKSHYVCNSQWCWYQNVIEKPCFCKIWAFIQVALAILSDVWAWANVSCSFLFSLLNYNLAAFTPNGLLISSIYKALPNCVAGALCKCTSTTSLPKTQIVMDG